MLDTHLQSAGLAYKVVLSMSSENVLEHGRVVLFLRLRDKGFMQVNKVLNSPTFRLSHKSKIFDRVKMVENE